MCETARLGAAPAPECSLDTEPQKARALVLLPRQKGKPAHVKLRGASVQPSRYLDSETRLGGQNRWASQEQSHLRGDWADPGPGLP